MNCFEFRRLIFADPRQLSQEMLGHKEKCPGCARLARQMDSFEAAIHETATVPVPDALAERIMLRHKSARPSLWFGFSFGGWALAASLVLAIAVAFQLDFRPAGEDARVVTAAALGSNHPAVATIAYVLDNEPQLLRENLSGDMAVLLASLEKTGMRLPADRTTIRYLGKCPVPPNGQGDHVVLQTAFGQASLILITDQTFDSTIVVADRNMLAMSAPTRSRNGSLILVADSLKTLKRFEAMLM